MRKIIFAGPAAHCLAVLLAVAGGAAGGCQCGTAASSIAQDQPAGELQPAWSEFHQRLPAAQGQIPEIIRAADAAAQRAIQNTGASIIGPNFGREDSDEDSLFQKSFFPEFTDRSGGLSNMNARIYLDQSRPYDIGLFAVRSWGARGQDVAKALKEYKDRGVLTIVLASSQGKPENLAADFFIDNGAPGPEDSHGRINAIVNALNGWMWCCEYVSALTRRGKYPGILLSDSWVESPLVNQSLQKSWPARRFLGECDVAIPPGQLAGLYLARVEQLVDQVASPQTQEQVKRAAKIIARHLVAGRHVMISGIGHLVMLELMRDNPPGWVSFPSRLRDAQEVFDNQLKKGDLLYWVGYVGMDSKYAQYAPLIRATDADLIVCLTPAADPSYNGPWALVKIDQSWAKGDAEVPIPLPPGRMAPISGINGTLLLRMVDDEVTKCLAAIAATQPATNPTSN